MESISGDSGRTRHRVITASVLFSMLPAVRRHRRAQKALDGFYIGAGFAGVSDGLLRAEAEAAAAARDLPPWLARRM